MEISKKSKINLSIGFLITGLFAVFMLIQLTPLEILEEKFYDFRFRVKGPSTPPDRVVIAAIDEKSIERFGRWPWTRDKLARLVDRLSEEEAELIVFDVILSESERHDASLGQAIRQAGNVLLPIVFEFDQKSTLPDPPVVVQSAIRTILHPERFRRYSPISTKRVLFPVPEMIGEVMALGHINMFPDGDGTLRWEALVVEHQGRLYPSIDVQAAAVFLGVPPDRIVLEATEGIRLGEKRYIPMDRFGRSLIPYYGPTRTFESFSISDILERRKTPGRFEGKIVLVGPTAVGIYDLRVTPFSPAMPGVEKHANVISAILEGKALQRVSLSTNLIYLLASGVLFSFLIVRLKAAGASLLTGGSLLLMFALGYGLFVGRGLWINIAYPANTILIIFITVMAYNYAVEERYAKKIKAMFSSYVTERVVSELIKNPGMAKLGGERRRMTVLFSDVKGFTSFSEKYTPEEVVNILNEYLGEMTEVIFKWEGTLDKFIGDAILAFWGAPMRQDNHAELAVRCALNMVGRLEALQERWKWEGRPVLDVGIGINSGDMLVGNIGVEGKKMDYTVIGDHVNLGVRIESLTRKYDTHILITGFTMEEIRTGVERGAMGHMLVRGKEKVVVKGKEKMVEIYEVRSLDSGSKSTILKVEGEDVAVQKEK